MKAVVYNGPRNVSVEQVPDPKIEQKTDVLVKIHTPNICGSCARQSLGEEEEAQSVTETSRWNPCGE